MSSAAAICCSFQPSGTRCYAVVYRLFGPSAGHLRDALSIAAGVAHSRIKELRAESNKLLSWLAAGEDERVPIIGIHQRIKCHQQHRSYLGINPVGLLPVDVCRIHFQKHRQQNHDQQVEQAHRRLPPSKPDVWGDR